MPQPRPARPPAPRQAVQPTQPRQPSAVGASLASATTAPAGLLATGALVGTLTTAQARAVTSGMVNGLRRLSVLRMVAIVAIVQRAATPIRPGASVDRPPYARRPVLEQLASDEREREMTFRRRQLVRIRRDLPRALENSDDRRRRARVAVIIGRETHYTRLRLDAIAGRAAGVAESLNVEEHSPAGGVWRLGPALLHSAGCVFLAGRALAWPALRLARYVPPTHGRCGCGLAALPEGAIPPTVEASLALIAAAKRLEDA